MTSVKSRGRAEGQTRQALSSSMRLPNEIEGASEWIEKNLDSVDILINNASISLDWSSINGGI